MPSPSYPAPRFQLSFKRSSSDGVLENRGHDDVAMNATSRNTTCFDEDEDDSSETEFVDEDSNNMEAKTPARTKMDTNHSHLWESLRKQSLNFPINTECTSLSLSPSGNFLWAGFSDGTMRLFDLSGRFDLDRSEEWKSERQKSHLFVPSTSHQRFGAVACQIHARGVHTDLLMEVHVCGNFCFGGVPRGAMEVYAVDATRLEQAVQIPQGRVPSLPFSNILDGIQVHGQGDAKLKGLGAVAQLQHQSRPTFLLLTGKGIKNIHIWKFQPPLPGEEDAQWECLYDTPTNGNTIHLLSFYRNHSQKLWGISQSDTQKLRLWDLSGEESSLPRPKRPPHQDVGHSAGALGIAGGIAICGGDGRYNQCSIVSLDQPKSAYNHTELALPSTGIPSAGRQRRGDLKQVVRVATLTHNSNHALMELDDGSIVHYQAALVGNPKLQILSEEATGIAPLPADFWCRSLCVGDIPGTVLAAVSLYNPNTQQGHVQVRSLLQPLSAEPPSSPQATDARALSQLCMEAPTHNTSLDLKMKKKKAKKRKRILEQERQRNTVSGSKDLDSQDEHVVHKKKKKAYTTITPSSERIRGDGMGAETVKKKMKKKKSSTIIPASVEKHREPRRLMAMPSMKPPSTASPTIDTDSLVVYNSTNTSANQVSPSMSTPAPRPRDITAPSSEESQPRMHSSISKFLKPKRLHNENEEEQLRSAQVPRKVSKILAMSETNKKTTTKQSESKPNDRGSAPNVASEATPVSSPPVPRKARPIATPKPEPKQLNDVGTASNVTTNPVSSPLIPRKSRPAATPIPEPKQLNDVGTARNVTTNPVSSPPVPRKSRPAAAPIPEPKLNDIAMTVEVAPASNRVSSPPVPRKYRPNATTKPEPKLKTIATTVEDATATNLVSSPQVPRMYKPAATPVPEPTFKNIATTVETATAANPVSSPPVPRKSRPTETSAPEPKQLNDIATAMEVGPAGDPVSSPPVPRISRPTTTSVPTSLLPRSIESSESFEIKVRKTLQIQSSSPKALDTHSAATYVNTKKRPSTSYHVDACKDKELSISGMKRDRTADRKEEVPETTKRARTATTASDSLSLESNPLTDVASLLIDLRTPKPKEIAPTKPSRDMIVNRRAEDQLQRLIMYMESLPKLRSRLLTQSPDSYGSFPALSSPEQTLSEHRAVQERIQKRLLQSTALILRSFINSNSSIDGAREELKETIRSYEEVLHNVMCRQDFEISTLIARNPSIPFPRVLTNFQAGFDLVQDIYHALEPPKRPPGRPKSL